MDKQRLIRLLETAPFPGDLRLLVLNYVQGENEIDDETVEKIAAIADELAKVYEIESRGMEEQLVILDSLREKILDSNEEYKETSREFFEQLMDNIEGLSEQIKERTPSTSAVSMGVPSVSSTSDAGNTGLPGM